MVAVGTVGEAGIGVSIDLVGSGVGVTSIQPVTAIRRLNKIVIVKNVLEGIFDLIIYLRIIPIQVERSSLTVWIN